LLYVRRQLVAIAVSLLAAGVLPASASAADCASAPDAAAIDQYCELLPTADGNGLTTTARGHGPRLRDVLSKEAVARLREEGALGEALLMLPVLFPGRVDEHGHPRGRPLLETKDLLEHRLAAPADADASRMTKALLKAAGQGGIPAALAWILGVTAVGGAAAGGMRFYRRTRLA
jgi:hypothetical protein